MSRGFPRDFMALSAAYHARAIMIGLRAMQPARLRTSRSDRYQIQKTLRNNVAIESAHPYLASCRLVYDGLGSVEVDFNPVS